MNSSAALSKTSQSEAWISSPGFDLAVFILSPLAGLALLLAYPIGGIAVTIAVATLVGGPHYIATYSFYFWDDTSELRRKRWVAYFLGPMAIVIAVSAVALFHIPAVIPLLIYFWNTYHVSRQSCGILAIYRSRAGDRARRDRTIANTAIITVGFAMALSHPEWYPLLAKLFGRIWPAAMVIVPRVLASLAALSLVVLAYSLYDRHRCGRSATTAELAFLGTSLVLFHPYLWVHDFTLATFGVLFGHFIQYLGIVWLVNQRKGAMLSGSKGQRAVGRLWREPKFLVPAFVTVGGLFLLLQLNLIAVTITLVLLHFYLDGIFWAFSRPEIRNSLGAYLFPEQRATSQ